MVQQITWQNVNAPDLTGAADILAKSVAGFGAAGAGFQENLQGIRDRQRRDRSATAIPLLAGIQSGGDVNAALARIAQTVRPEDMTPELQASVLAARGIGLGYDQTTANTNSVNSATGRANQDQQRKISREDQLAALTPEFMRQQAAAINGTSMPATLSTTESGNNDRAVNAQGYGGNLQFGDARLADAAAAGIIDHPMTGAEFAQQPADVQRKVEAWQATDINKFIRDQGLDGYIGKVVNGVVVTAEGMQAVAHLGGKDGLRQYLQSNGTYDPHDANGTTLTAYMGIHGAQGMQQNYVQDMSGLLQPGNLLTPDDVKAFQTDILNTQRTRFQNETTDRNNAISEAAGIKTAADTAQTANIDRDARANLEQIIKGIGPSVTAGDPSRQMFDAINSGNYDPKLRDAMRVLAPSYLDAAAPGYKPAVPLPVSEQDSILAANASQLAVDSTLDANGPMGALIAAGVVEDPNAASVLAPDGTVLPKGMVGQTSLVSDQIAKLTGGDTGKVNQSVAQIQDIVDDVYKKYDGQIDKSVIMAMVGQNLSSTHNWWDANTLTVDKKALIQSLAPIATKPMQKQYIEDNRQKYLAAQATKLDLTRYQDAEQTKWYWDNNPNLPGAKAKSEAAQKVMDDAFKRVTDAGTASGVKAQEAELLRLNPGMTLEQIKKRDADLAAANDPKAAQLAAQTSAQRRDAILAGESIPTPSGRTVDPNASGFGQTVDRVQRNDEIANATMKMREDLATSGGSVAQQVIGNVSDWFSSTPDQSKANKAERQQKSDAIDWFNSDAAMQVFSSDPSLLAQAKQDPLGFYLALVKGKQPDQGPRSTGGQRPMSGVNAALATHAAPVPVVQAPVTRPIQYGLNPNNPSGGVSGVRTRAQAGSQISEAERRRLVAETLAKMAGR